MFYTTVGNIIKQSHDVHLNKIKILIIQYQIIFGKLEITN